MRSGARLSQLKFPTRVCQFIDRAPRRYALNAQLADQSAGTRRVAPGMHPNGVAPTHEAPSGTEHDWITENDQEEDR